MTYPLRNWLIVVMSWISLAWTPQSFAQPARASRPSHNDGDMKSVVRLFYQPEGGNYFHSALLFRSVNKGAAHLNTAPIFRDGRTAYIIPEEMRHLIQGLEDLELAWKHTERVEKPPTIDHYALRNELAITIYTSERTDKAFLDPQRICSTLAPLDTVFVTPRALWEFQLFRFKYHCEVRGFDPNAYPLRDIENK